MTRFYRSTSIILTVVMVMTCLVTSCRRKGSDFPDIDYPEDPEMTESSAETTPDDIDIIIPTITVASPYSNEAITYLAKLYYCKNNDLLGENTGATVSLDFLDGIDPDFIVDSILTSGEGASVDNILMWNLSDRGTPDVFLTDSVSAMQRNDLICPLNEYISDSVLLSPGRVYSGALNSVAFNGSYYAIPFYETVMVLAGNTDYIPSSGKLSFKNSTTQFEEYLSSMKAEYNCIPLSSGYDLAPYLNSAFVDDNAVSFMMHDEYRTDNAATVEIIGNTLGYLNGLYSNGLTANLSDNGTNPVFARQAGLWLITSSEVSNWEQYFPSSLYYVALPCSSDSASITPMARLYSLCVNQYSASKEFASEFALFMALDPDARMLLERLEPQVGFLPCVKSQDVWNIVTEETIFGQTASYYSQALDRAVYCPSQTDDLYIAVTDYLSNYNGGAFDAGACYGLR